MLAAYATQRHPRLFFLPFSASCRSFPSTSLKALAIAFHIGSLSLWITWQPCLPGHLERERKGRVGDMLHPSGPLNCQGAHWWGTNSSSFLKILCLCVMVAGKMRLPPLCEKFSPQWGVLTLIARWITPMNSREPSLSNYCWYTVRIIKLLHTTATLPLHWNSKTLINCCRLTHIPPPCSSSFDSSWYRQPWQSLED